ncbi:hypothetical protein [Streptomyces sp. NPDC102437]|uniref:hypothetical protein n=1 Tax=Streptomyces sp. NPDC102437 TaxID=3366175 RepID=UPI0038249A8B
MNLRTHARKCRKDCLHPRGWTPYALGGAVVAVLLATTACEPGGLGEARGDKGTET